MNSPTHRRLFFLLLLSCAPVLAHAEQWNKTYPITGKPELRVNTDDADVRVHGCDCKEVRARVEWEHFKPGAVQVTESQTGDRVVITVRTHVPHSGFGVQWRRQWVHMDLAVPNELLLAALTGDGSLELEGVKGDLDVKTGDGKIDANNVEGMLRAHSGDGAVTLSGRFDRLEVTTSDGSVHVDVKAGSLIKSGWNIRSGDGSVHVRLPKQFAADVRAHTGDGSIRSELPITVTGNLNEKQRIEGRLNGGGGMLSIQTGDGDVYLEQL